MRLLICIMICLGIQNLYAQTNLVSNGSFENPNLCPNITVGNLLDVCFSDWGTPNQGSPDYYSYCSDYAYFRPDNAAYGSEEPLDGESFAAMYLFALNQLEQGEYIQTRLTQPIHSGVRYQVSFHVSLAELSLYAISSIGAYLSVDQIQDSGFDVFDVEPQIQNPAGNIIADTSGWVLVTDTFVSRQGGGEEWLTIGNFNYAAESDTFRFQPINPDMGGSYFSYYYIDDVSVVALDSVPSGIAEQEELGFELWPNPAREFVRFRLSGPSASLRVTVRVLDAVGRPSIHHPLVADGTQDDHTIDVSGLPSGMYFLELMDEEGRRAVQRFVKE